MVGLTLYRVVTSIASTNWDEFRGPGEDPPTPTGRGEILPQHVPSSRCRVCDVCCRFPEKTSPLAPYFTADEIRRAIARGVPSARFARPEGGRIELVPDARATGFLCPAFEPATGECRIYEDRPLDCQLYPLALMWNPARTAVLLGFDRKCPFITDTLFDPAAREYARAVASRIESDVMIDRLRSHPALIGAFQEDVMVHMSLPRLAAALGCIGPPGPGSRSPEEAGLTSLTETDRTLFESALRRMKAELSDYSWPALMIWRDHLRYYWTIIDRQFCLFAESRDGLFMPLAPAGEALGQSCVRRCFEIMDSVNSNPAVSRIENLDAAMIPAFEAMGFSIRAKESEYLYTREDLVLLSGNRYKSRRWAVNRFLKDHRGQSVRIEAYRAADRDECLDLYARWKDQHRLDDPEDRMMMEDAASAHRRALEECDRLGLFGRVVRRSGKIVAYTFGYPLRPGLFCVLVEIADRSIPGLSSYLFREFCREMAGFTTVHAMGDSGLARLRRAKLSYHPSRVVESYIAAREFYPND